MSLKGRKSNLSKEEQKVFEDYFLARSSNFKYDEKPENKNNEKYINDLNENLNESEKNYINDTQVGIIDKNENENKKSINYKIMFVTNIDETKKKDLLNSKIPIFPKNIKKIFSKTKILDGQNQSINFKSNQKKPKKKRGRVKKSNDNRFHGKKAKDNIKLKIYGLIINSCRSFINKKLKTKILKKICYQEKINFCKDKKFMDKKLKDIYGKVSKGYGENYNKNIINTCDPKVKEIFELPMYKVILAISGVEINILKGLDHEYNVLKDQLFLKEDDDDDYINLFNEREASIINLAMDKYPINEDLNINFISNNNSKILEVSPLSSGLFNENESKLINWSKFEFSNEGITRTKTSHYLEKNVDKTFLSSTNDKMLFIDDLPWQMPDISNIIDKKLDTNELYRQMPDKFNNSNINDCDSLSSKYSLISFNNENDDFH